MKADFKKTLPAYTAHVGRFDLVEVPPLRYLMIDGHGDPNTSPMFAEAISTLFPIAYALKFESKNALNRDYVVMPLEGLWWSENHDVFTGARDKSQWRWTLMVMQPDWITDTMVSSAIEKVARKDPDLPVSRVRWETLEEGLSVQTLHIGPFDDEGAVLEEMHDHYIPDNQLRLTGKHHEIYLSDPRKSAPEKRRTILRQPVERV